MLSLPSEIITRILYFTFLSDGLRSIASFCATCHSAYRFHFLLLTLKPLSISPRSGKEPLKRLLPHTQFVRVLNIHTGGRGFTRYVASRLSIFSKLEVLCIQSQSIKSMDHLVQNVPQSVKSLSLILKQRLSTVREGKYPRIPINLAIEHLAISTDVPLCQGGRFYLFSPRLFNWFSQKEARMRLFIRRIVSGTRETIKKLTLEGVDLRMLSGIVLPSLRRLFLDVYSARSLDSWHNQNHLELLVHDRRKGKVYEFDWEGNVLNLRVQRESTGFH